MIKFQNTLIKICSLIYIYTFLGGETVSAYMICRKYNAVLLGRILLTSGIWPNKYLFFLKFPNTSRYKDYKNNKKYD